MKRVIGVLVGLALVGGMTGVASGDLLDNNLTISSKPGFTGNDLGVVHPPDGVGTYYEVIAVPAGGTATVNLELIAGSGQSPSPSDPAGCNASVGTPAVLTVNRATTPTPLLTDLRTTFADPTIASATAATLATSAASVEFTGCGVTVPLVVTGGSVVNQATTFNFNGAACPAGSTCALTGRFVALTVPSNTAPVVTITNKPSSPVEGNTTGGANVAFGPVTVTDAEDDPDPALGSCFIDDGSPVPVTVASGDFFALGGPYTVKCVAEDSEGAEGSDSFTFTVVDTTAPTLTVPADITETATSATGNAIDFTGLGATDIVDANPTIVCKDTSVAGTPEVESGDTFLGTHVIECVASDASGNDSPAQSFTITVTFGFSGFFPPAGSSFNVVKAGSTVPIKFRISDGAGGSIGTLAIIAPFDATGVRLSCTTGLAQETLDAFSTNPVGLRYDASARQFIYNWKSPKTPGACYRVIIALTDGTTHAVDFQLR